LPGSPISLMNNNFEACTEQCAAAGTSCAGVTFGSFGGSQQLCYLYTRMLATSEAPEYPIVAAVRTSNSDGALSRRQILQNGGFDGTLTPWTSGQTANGAEFRTVDNTAYVRMTLANAGADVEDTIVLQQQISDPVGANSAYFTSMDITVEPIFTGPAPRKRQSSESQVTCSITLRSAEGDTYVSQTLDDTEGPKTVYGSGTVQEAGIQIILINAVCSGSRNVVIRFDNVNFSALEAEISEPGCDTSLLKNGDFDSELAPWTASQGSFNSASVAVSGGRAVVTWSRNAGAEDDIVRITQSSVAMPGENQPYRIIAQLIITIASGFCEVGFENELERLYFTGRIEGSQTLSVTYDGFSEVPSSQFAVTVKCYSPDGGINSVGIDSVALVMNPGAECPSSSTTG
jgi:hypothetical protein